MLKVYKYQLNALELQELFVVKNAQILSVANQHERLCLWALLDGEETQFESRKILVVGTGHALPHGEFRFIGTVLFEGDSLVFHVFEKID